MENCIDFVIRIPIAIDHNDFRSHEFLKQLQEWCEKSLGDTSWDYKVFEHHHYPIEVKIMWCGVCGDTSHVSVDGENFRCMCCEYDAIRKIIIEGV